MDLQGPKIRLGCFDGGYAVLEPGSVFTVTRTSPTAPSRRSRVEPRRLHHLGALAQDLAPGDTILIDDGLIKLTAISSDGTEVACRVIEGGLVSDHKASTCRCAESAPPR